MKKNFLCYLLVFFLVFNSVSFVSLANDNPYYGKADWDSLSNKEKIGYYLGYLKHNAGLVFSGKFDDSKQFTEFFEQYKNGTIEKKVSDMTESEYEDYCGKMVDLVKDDIKIVQNGQKKQLHISADTNNAFKSYAKKVISDIETPLYYTVHIPSIDQLYPSNFGYTYVYNQIKQAVNEFGLIAIYGFSPDYVSFFDLPDDMESYFFIGKSNYYPSYYCTGKWSGGTLYNVSNEFQTKFPAYTISFDDDKTIITDIKDNYSSYTPSTTYSNIYIDYLDCVQAFSPTQSIPVYNAFLIAPNDMYIKNYTSLKNYQNSLAGKVERKIYYTSNYYNNNYSDTDVDLDTLYKYMDNIQSILETLQKEEKENNYDEDALTRRLDALINAIWSTTGDISGDTGTIVDQNKKTNSWLEKIYDKVTDIKKSIVKDTNVTDDWNKQIDNVVSNSNNSTVLNVFLMDLQDAFTPVAKKAQTKLPFSLPWDMYFVATLLYAEPEAPVYTLPMKLDSFGIDTELVIDCNHIKFLSSVSRTLLTLLYMLGLIKLTFKVIALHEGESQDA